MTPSDADQTQASGTPKPWYRLRWPTWLAVGLLIIPGLYANFRVPPSIEGNGYGFPAAWTWLNMAGRSGYNPLAMVFDIAIYIGLGIATASQVEHMLGDRVLRFRFSMFSMFVVVTAAAVLARLIKVYHVDFSDWREMLIDYPLPIAGVFLFCCVIRSLDGVSRGWMEREAIDAERTLKHDE